MVADERVSDERASDEWGWSGAPPQAALVQKNAAHNTTPFTLF